MTKNQKKFLIFSFLAVFITVSAYASEVGRFIASEGKVDVLKAGADQARPVFEGESFSNGDIIRTKSLSKAEVKFKDGTLLKLAENTRLEVGEYKLNESGLRNNAIINLQRGEIRAVVQKTIGDTNFFVNTPNASAAAGNSDIFVFYNKSATGAMVNDGIISIASKAFPDKPVNVSKGFISLISSGQPPQQPRPYMDVEKRRHDELTKAIHAPAQGDPSDIKAMVVKLSGDVEVRRRETAAWRSVRLNDIFGSGDQIDTKDTGMIEIKLDNGNIITLKPNSSIMLTELKRDVKTGDYINLFDANIGNLRAKVQKLKGSSKFQIRTPTATASVRGTIMYLEILPGLTRVFFQNGTGIITSLISNITKAVHDGQMSSADGQGNVSDVTDASDAEQDGWTNGWATPEAEPYTEPGPGEGLGEGGESGGGGSKGETGGGYVPDTTGIGGANPVVDVPLDPDNVSPVTQPTAQPAESFVEASGDFGTSQTGSFISDNTSSFNAAMTSPVSGESWSGQSSVEVEGTFDNPNDESLWTAAIGSAEGEDGAFVGQMAGSWNSWEGAIAALFIDPSGTAGTMNGFLEGTTDDRQSTLIGDGSIFFVPITQTDIPPEQLLDTQSELLSQSEISGYMNAYFVDNTGPGYFNGEITKSLTYIDGEPWGIWFGAYTGDYDRPFGSGEWDAIGGGMYNEKNEELYPTYFISAIHGVDDGSDDLGGGLRMDVLSTYLSPIALGSSWGTVLGSYYPGGSYDFEGVGLGTYAEEPLVWSAEVDAYYHYYDDDELDYDDYHYGIIGSTESPFASPGHPVDITLMGETYPYYYITWWGSLYGSNAGDGSVIPDGFIGGRTNSSEGILAALYVDDLGNAGTLRGNFTGNYYDELNMWDAEGSMTANQMAAGYDPDDYYDDTAYKYINGDVEGDFNGNGYIDIEDDISDMSEGYLGSYTRWLVDPFTDEPEPWGIYNIELGGYYGGPTSNEWTVYLGGDDWRGLDDEEYWAATITGSQWSNQRIAGELEGSYITYTEIGTIEGDVLGSYNTEYDDEWEAIALGAYSGQPAAWSAEIDATYYYYDYYDDALDYDDYHYGIIGSTESPFASPGHPVDITLMGETYPYYYITWWGSLYGSNAGDGSVIPDGFIGGTTNSIEGMLATLYIDNAGNAGTLRGDFTGSYYEGLDMWQAGGSITANQMAAGYDPDNYYSDYNYINGDADGNFNVGGYSDLYLDYSINYIGGDGYGYTDLGSYTAWLINPATNAPEPWGIYNIELGGYYYGTTSNDWTLPMGGSDWRGLEDGEYWVAVVTGSRWSDQEIAGELEGAYITSTEMGTIEGSVLGSYDTDDYDQWEAIALGTYSGQPTTFSGYWAGNSGSWDVDSFYYYNGDEFSYAGSEYGLIGSTTASWWNAPSFQFLAMGFYTAQKSIPLIWDTAIYSYNDIEGDNITIDGGVFAGFAGGSWNNEEMNGALSAIYISPDGNAGVLRGNVSGNYYPSYVDMWQAGGDLTPTFMGITQFSLEDIIMGEGIIDSGEFEGGGEGSFAGGGMIEAAYVDNIWFGIADQDWGIWNTMSGGTWEGPASPFRLAIGAYSDDAYNDSYWLGTVSGDWESGEIDGVLKGIFMHEADGVDNDSIVVGSITGDVTGNYIDVADGTNTWQAVGVGEWVDIAELDPDILGFDMADMADFVSVPITETYASLLQGPGAFDAGGTIAGIMDMSIFNNEIWTALISGAYSGPTSDTWNLALQNGPDTVDLAGNQWSDGEWLAGVSGTVDGNTIEGQAGGIYGNGEFQGVGAGTADTP